MDKTLVIVGHPDLTGNSLANRIIVERLAGQDNLEVRVLKNLYPDFQIDIEAEQAALLEADTVVLQFPFYWYSIPAILKEWIDQVLTYGFAYGETGTKLHGKKLILSTTVGGPAAAYVEGGDDGHAIDAFLYPLQQTAKLTGMVYLPPVVSHDMIYIPDVYNVKEEVEERAHAHAYRLWIALLKANGETQSSLAATA